MFEMVIDHITGSRDTQKVSEFVFTYLSGHSLISKQKVSREGCAPSVQFRYPLKRKFAIGAFHPEK